MNVQNRVNTDRVLVCVPCKDRAPIELTQCLMNIRLSVPFAFLAIKGSLISEQRDTAVNLAINDGYSHLMFIDDDILFPPDGIQRLYDAKKPIASGLYVSKDRSRLIAWDNLRIENDRLIGDTITVKKPYQTVDSVGMGFCLIKTEVFKEIAKESGTMFFPQYQAGEDLTFCYLANKCGYRVHLDTSLDIYHLGLYGFGVKDYEQSAISER